MDRILAATHYRPMQVRIVVIHEQKRRTLIANEHLLSWRGRQFIKQVLPVAAQLYCATSAGAQWRAIWIELIMRLIKLDQMIRRQKWAAIKLALRRQGQLDARLDSNTHRRR